MKAKTLTLAALGTAIALTLPTAPKVSAADQFIPMLVYRTGPYAPNGIAFANGYRDYMTLLNKRDGGINGVKLTLEECETKYTTKLGVECYEKLKGKGAIGAALFNPLSTGITYQLIPKAAVDKITIHSMGYGRTAAGDGRVFKWAFTAPTSYWSQASAVIKYIGSQVGGMDKLKGKKIAHVYHNSAYGKEANPTLELLSKKYGYELKLLAVDHPGQEQKATWLQIRRYKPDWIYMSGWGVMNSVAIKEAAAVKFPMDRFVGNWWSGTESDVRPSGTGAKGYKSAAFHGAGPNYAVHKDIVKHLYGGDKAKAQDNNFGEVLYNRGIMNAVYTTEAIRTAMKKFGNKPITGEQARWGLENLNLTSKRLSELGLKDFAQPHKITCEDHEGSGPVIIQQWDGKKWTMISDWVKPMRDLVRPMIEKAAADYAKENNITPRSCK
ncbi:MAG: ABC transporter substrate-binding protein [Alphaproteobacteria bacterium]|nr:ABC transporter substrate-binding protein [Alphaproteobacteria bacterium]